MSRFNHAKVFQLSLMGSSEHVLDSIVQCLRSELSANNGGNIRVFSSNSGANDVEQITVENRYFELIKRYHVVCEESSLGKVSAALQRLRRQYTSDAIRRFGILSAKEEHVIQVKMDPKGMKCVGCATRIRTGLAEKLPEGALLGFYADYENSKEVYIFVRQDVATSDVLQILSGDLGKQFTLLYDSAAAVVQSNTAPPPLTQGLVLSTYEVMGMKCEGCVSKITDWFSSASSTGAEVLDVDLESKRVLMLREASKLTSEGLTSIFTQDLEFPSATVLDETAVNRINLRVEGMSCGKCIRTLRTSLADDSRIVYVQVDLPNNTAAIFIRQEADSLSEAVLITMINTMTSYSASAMSSQDVLVSVPIQEPPVCPLPTSVSQELNEISISSSEEDLQRVTVQIEGMTCASCVSKIESSIRSSKGIHKAAVNLMAQKGVFTFDKKLTSAEEIVSRVQKLGYEAKELEQISSEEGKASIEVAQGLSSQDDAGRLERLIRDLQGIFDVKIDTKKKRVQMEFDPSVTNVRFVLEALKAELGSGFDARPLSGGSGDDTRKAILRGKEIRFYRTMFFFSATFSIPAMFIMLVLGNINEVRDRLLMVPVAPGLMTETLVMFILSTPVVIFAGWKFIWLALKALRHFSFDMNTLIAIATVEAYVFSIGSAIYGIVDPSYQVVEFFETAASLIMFMLLGRFLENLAKRKTSQALVALMDLKPKEALLLDFRQEHAELKKAFLKDVQLPRGIEERKIAADLLASGDVVKILPGDKVPCDGLVLFGSSSVDESMITGESVPVQKYVGDEVIGGTINTDGVLLVQATRVGANSTLSSIAKLVEEAQTQKPKIQAIADKISGLFVPVVIVLSLVTLIVWIILGYTGALPPSWRDNMNEFVFALRFAVTVVIIACPCALGLATPSALMVGTGVAAKHGILIKGGGALEQTRGATAIMFDKTGTLTTGVMGVNDLVFVDKSLENDRDLMMRVAAVESSTEHPIAQSIRSFIRVKLGLSKDYTFETPTDFVSLAGRGVKSQSLVVGNLVLMEEEKIDCSALDAATQQRLLNSPQTLIYVGLNGKLVCVFGVSDQPKAQSARVVRYLQKKLGLQVYMLTGDRERVALHVAEQLGIPRTHVFADCSPADKQNKVIELQQKQKKKHRVIMVGDGINDAVSLTQADVGFAIGQGTQIASEAADVVLMSNSITSVVNAISISRVVYRQIIINFVWAFLYNLVLVPIAAGVLYPAIRPVIIPPWAAGAAMIVSSISVLLASLALRFYRAPKICREKKERQSTAEDQELHSISVQE